ncbi:alpha/beta hydrolase [Pseudarthrobacter phenanthrenivorans]|jgi:pimeloyl-ACP methyl ester carboxylesterase|uniref:Alpha/beta hydrolase n=1 Tax=Pseudarthrobacter phenanthrenivorans TaxID=361575 RepID=A0A3B0G455_PSEPS|nr:alpha/beta hydrolase [Pseudarthrobacter phenanthrenivorans]RKO26910.1 alpha/beta hydrolase [Pseudarthrobacter phenanthrenivorans]TPV49007.1 alpha/beta hydrolase [Pseudarthrobacter phenanthrenivorans]
MFKQRVVFVHGAGTFGAAAWPRQHGLALSYDALFLRRHGYDPFAEPVEPSFAEDTRILLRSLGDDGRGAAGGHVVAHAQGAIPAMMAAVERPDLVYSLTLVEPACLSLTAELPATAAHIALMQPLFDARRQLSDEDFQREFVRRVYATDLQHPVTVEEKRSARRLRLQAPPWEAPLHIVPGVPTLVLTGGWEPLYEEIAGYLRETGAVHRTSAGGHRPHDSPEGDRIIRAFVSDVSRVQPVRAS